jgi:hypothetical protein
VEVDMKKIIILFCLFLIPLVLALDVGVLNDDIGINIVKSSNISNYNVSSAEIWVTDEGNLDNVADITYDDISGGDVNALGYTGYFNYLAGVVGQLSMDGSPWYLAGVDLQIVQNLLVGNITSQNHNPEETLAWSLGTGALRWLNLYVQNINAEQIDAYDMTLSGDLTVGGVINGVNISNLASAIQLKNNSLASGNTYLLTNTTWDSVNSVINNIRITTECESMNMSICTDSGCTSEDVLYAERYKNASTYGSYTYMNADNKAGVYVKYYCNSGADTLNIYLGGITA